MSWIDNSDWKPDQAPSQQDPLDILEGVSECLHCGQTTDPLDLGPCPECGHQPYRLAANCRCPQCSPPSIDPKTLTEDRVKLMLKAWLDQTERLGKLQLALKQIEDVFQAYLVARQQDDEPLSPFVTLGHLFQFHKGKLTARPITIIV
jgi:hypothetical protein